MIVTNHFGSKRVKYSVRVLIYYLVKESFQVAGHHMDLPGYSEVLLQDFCSILLEVKKHGSIRLDILPLVISQVPPKTRVLHLPELQQTVNYGLSFFREPGSSPQVLYIGKEPGGIVTIQLIRTIVPPQSNSMVVTQLPQLILQSSFHEIISHQLQLVVDSTNHTVNLREYACFTGESSFNF